MSSSSVRDLLCNCCDRRALTAIEGAFLAEQPEPFSRVDSRPEPDACPVEHSTRGSTVVRHRLDGEQDAHAGADRWFRPGQNVLVRGGDGSRSCFNGLVVDDGQERLDAGAIARHP